MAYSILLWSCAFLAAIAAQCPDYSDHSTQYHRPYSSGRYNLSYQRPEPACRTFNSSLVEDTITSMQSVIKDPDLFRLFENSYPNSLDTAVKWKGYADNGTDEELTFLITGDMYVGFSVSACLKASLTMIRNAMWLRDSANQMQSYLPLLKADSSNNSLASLYRGVINLQARYILTSPHCNSFQPPVESGIAPTQNGGEDGYADEVFPSYSNSSVFECKYELDSLAAFLEISTNYFEATNDSSFFAKYSWVNAVQTILDTTKELQIGTYSGNGTVNTSPYTFERYTTSGTETETNSGVGNPVQEGTGLVRSAFRPSDDVCIYQLFIPANMMFSRYLASSVKIMASLPGQAFLASEMSSFAASIKSAISQYGLVDNGKYGIMYAFEVDGFGGRNMMDDANIPSLLSIPFLGFADTNDTFYQNTRKFVLSTDNPYYMRGPVINAVGGPHAGPGRAWPMSVYQTPLR